MRRFLRILLRTLAVLVVLVVLAYLFRNALFGRMVADRIAAEIGKAAGGKWSVHAVEGSWLSDFAVVGLRMEEPPPHGPLAGFSCGRAEASFSLMGLLGDDPLAAVESVAVKTVTVEVDLTRPEAPDAEPAEESAVFELPELPKLAIDGTVTVRTEEQRYAGRFTITETSARLDELDVPEAPELTSVTATFERIGPRRVRVTANQEGLGEHRVEQALVSWSETGWDVEGDVYLAGGRVILTSPGESIHVSIGKVDLALVPLLSEPVAGRVSGTVTMRGLDNVQVELRGDRIRFRDVDVRSVSVDAAWRDGVAYVSSLLARMPDGHIVAEGLRIEPERPYYVAAADSISVLVPDLRKYVPDLEFPVLVSATVKSGDGRALEIEADVEVDEALVTLRGGATLPQEAKAWKQTGLELDLSGRGIDISYFDVRVPTQVLGKFQVRGAVRGTIEKPVAQLDVFGKDLTIEGRKVREVSVKGDLDWPLLRDMTVRLDADAGRLFLTGRADLEKRVLQDGSYEIDVPDLAELAALLPEPPRVKGSLAGKGKVVWDGEKPVGQANLTGTGLVFEDTDIGTLTARATVDGPRVVIEELAGEGAWGTANAHGLLEWDERRARIDGLVGTHRDYAAKLLAPLQLAWDDGRYDAKGLACEIFGGTVRGDVTWTGRPQGTITGEGLDLSLLDRRLAGRARMAVRMDENGYSVDVHAPDLKADGRAGVIDIRARYADATGIFIDLLNVDAGDLLQLKGQGVLPFRFGPDGVVRIDGVTPSAELEGEVRDFSAMPQIGATRALIVLKADGEKLSGTATVRDLAMRGEVLFPGDTWIQLKLRPDVAVVSVAAPKSEFGELQAAVRSDRGLDWTRPEQYQPVFDAARIDGTVDMNLPDLAALKRVAPDLRHIEGRAHVQLTVSGSVRAPAINGTATLAEVTFTPGGDLPPVQNVRGRLEFDQRVLRLAGIHGELGYEPVGLAGSVAMPDGEPIAIDLTLVGDNLLLARSRYMRLRADVDVALKGPIDQLAATGKIRLRDALYSEPTQIMARSAPTADGKLQLFSIRTGALRDLKWDIAITGDETFRIRNNVMRGDFSVDLVLGGTGEVPAPTGRVEFRDTLVKLPFSSLKVDRGRVVFPKENPFAPSVRVAAHTRMKGYDLDVVVEGEMSELEIHISSRPTLSQEDAILLLTTGVTRRDLERDGMSRTALVKVATYFGQSLAASASGPSDPDERTFFDRFSFELGRDISRAGRETVEGEFEMNDRFYLRGERDRFDDYNLGVVWRYKFR